MLDRTQARGSYDLQGMDRFYDQAFDLLSSPRVADVFNLKKEPQKVGDAYGTGHRGACYLMGRKLIEAGVRFATIDVRWPFTKDLPGGFTLDPGFIRPPLGCSKQITLYPCLADKLDRMGVVMNCKCEKF